MMNFMGSKAGRAAYRNDVPSIEPIALAIVGVSGLVSGASRWSMIARDRQLSVARALGIAAATACVTFVLVSVVFVGWVAIQIGSSGLFFYALLFVVVVAAIPYGVPLALLMIGWTFVWRRLVNAAMP